MSLVSEQIFDSFDKRFLRASFSILLLATYEINTHRWPNCKTKYLHSGILTKRFIFSKRNQQTLYFEMYTEYSTKCKREEESRNQSRKYVNQFSQVKIKCDRESATSKVEILWYYGHQYDSWLQCLKEYIMRYRFGHKIWFESQLQKRN